MYGNRDDIVEYSSQYLPSTYKNTNTYYITKEYNYDFSTDRFTLKEPIAILGSDMSIDYVGYYTYNSDISNESNQYIYKITSVASKLSGMTVNYSYVTYGTTSKKKAQTNTNSSDIKAYIDTWYENNIKGTANERYVADNIFCNDRSFALNNVGTGSGTTNTYYRWSSFANNSNNNKMMLMCPQQMMPLQWMILLKVMELLPMVLVLLLLMRLFLLEGGVQVILIIIYTQVIIIGQYHLVFLVANMLQNIL